jgi:hypothetical protein
MNKPTINSPNKSSKLTAAEHFKRPRPPRRHTEPAETVHAPNRVDRAVTPAAFEDEAPQLTNDVEHAQDPAHLKSVVVDRADEFDMERSAQLTQPNTGIDETGSNAQQTAEPTDVNSQLEQDLRLPFGPPNNAQPPTEQPAPGFETMQPPDADQPPPTGTQQEQEGAEQFEPLPDDFLPDLPTDGAAQAPPGDVPIASPEKIEEERRKSEAACEESLANLRAKTIATVNLTIAVSGTAGEDFPFECTLDENEWHGGRAWLQTTVLWKASALCHKPLFFEDEQLERYGHSFAPCCQPLISGAHFFSRLPILPYCMGVEPPTECIYALGHYRPGSCAPYMCDPIPISYRGALFQAGAVVGAAAVLP